MLLRMNQTWNIKVITSFLLIFTLFAALVGASFAWLTDHTKAQHDEEFEATAISSYFGGSGDGSTAEKAYLIQNATHLYNLAWLQNIGKISPGTYFKLDNNIDMAGLLNGTTQESGAIPPIGTDENPFQGHFDGQGKVISNLWVSTNPDDWKEHPDIAELKFDGNCVGLFGVIGDGGVATNFILHKLEVKSSIPESIVGLICGKVDQGGHLSKVGVSNGILSFASGVDVTSKATLVGQLANGVNWSDNLGASAGGDIIIDPFTDNIPANDDTTSAVPPTDKNTIPDAAFIAGAYSIQNTGFGNFYENETNTKFSYVEGPNTPVSKKEIENRIGAYGNNVKKNILIFDETPGGILSNSNKVTQFAEAELQYPLSENETTLSIPSNCVWFKPKQDAWASVVFLQTSNSTESTMSLYEFDRANSVLIKVQDFKMPKGNKTARYYQAKVEAGKEYVIGLSTESKNMSAGFLMFILGGTSMVDGGSDGTPKSYLKDVDYVPNTNSVDWSTYSQREVILQIDGSTTAEGSMTFCAVGDQVYHKSPVSGLVIQDLAGQNKSIVSDTYEYQERDKNK